jgi:hypothetical protein
MEWFGGPGKRWWSLFSKQARYHNKVAKAGLVHMAIDHSVQVLEDDINQSITA